ncbi:hypothetical protein V1291_005203 [Nitrobacteraceae bacterium AZCC 1564]
MQASMKWNFEIDDAAGDLIQCVDAKEMIDFRLGYFFRGNLLQQNDIATTNRNAQATRNIAKYTQGRPDKRISRAAGNLHG